MHAIDLFQFSKHLRDSGKFSSEQTEALADALFAAMNDIDVDQPHVPIRQQPEHNKTTAALLGIFLGGIGAHKFYLGRSLQGVFYLIFCWTLIPAIIGFVEGLYYLSYTMDEFTAEYG